MKLSKKEANMRDDLKEIIVNITRDHDTDTLEEVMDKYIDQILAVVATKMPEKKEVEKDKTGVYPSKTTGMQAIGFNKAIDLMHERLGIK